MMNVSVVVVEVGYGYGEGFGFEIGNIVVGLFCISFCSSSFT